MHAFRRNQWNLPTKIEICTIFAVSYFIYVFTIKSSIGNKGHSTTVSMYFISAWYYIKKFGKQEIVH